MRASKSLNWLSRALSCPCICEACEACEACENVIGAENLSTITKNPKNDTGRINNVSNTENLTVDQNIALHELEGFMVLGLVAEGGSLKPRGIPVLSTSPNFAISLATESMADFQVVGVISETDLNKHLLAIEDHRRLVKLRS